MTSDQINWYEVLRRLQSAGAAATTGRATAYSEGAAEVAGLRAWLEESVEEDRHLKSLYARLDGIRQAMADGGEVPTALADLVTEVRESLPDFRVVVLAETKHWPEAIQAEAGSVYGAYLFDARRQVHMGDLRPSCELHHLYNTALNEVTDDVNASLLDQGSESQFMYAENLGKIGLDQVHICGEPNDLSAETYDEMVAAMVEDCRANVRIQTPRPLGATEGIRAALHLLALEDQTGAQRVVDAMPRVVSAIVEDISRERGSLIKGLDMASTYLRVKRDEEYGTPLYEKVAGADSAALFFKEVIETHGTLNAVAERFGADAVAKVSYMQAALLSNSGVDAWPEAASIVDLVETLPSSARWLETMTFYNKFGEQVPREAFGMRGTTSGPAQLQSVTEKVASAESDASPAP